MSTVLKMEHIEKVYGNQVRALHDISLEVSAGDLSLLSVLPDRASPPC